MKEAHPALRAGWAYLHSLKVIVSDYSVKTGPISGSTS